MTSPPPGTYITEPFKCIVIVPGGSIDPVMVLSPPAKGRILQGRPALRFIPRQPHAVRGAR